MKCSFVTQDFLILLPNSEVPHYEINCEGIDIEINTPYIPLIPFLITTAQMYEEHGTNSHT